MKLSIQIIKSIVAILIVLFAFTTNANAQCAARTQQTFDAKGMT